MAYNLHEFDPQTMYCKFCGLAEQEAMLAPGLSAWSCLVEPRPWETVRERRAHLWPYVPVSPRDIDDGMPWVAWRAAVEAARIAT